MSALRFSRRRLLRWSAGAALGATAAGVVHSATRDLVRLALVGCGGRGRQLASTLRWTGLARRGGQLVALCDANRPRAERIRDESWPKAVVYEQYQELLDRDDIEGVIVATPDHWHAPITLAALHKRQAVYCEKPLTLTVAEGQILVDAVRRTGGILQVGTQQRSDWRFRTACELARNGRLGHVKRVEVTLPTSSLPPHATGGPFSASPIPNGLNWDLWLGQAPSAEFCKQRYDPFRWWFEYSGGFMTDWGAHHLDIVHRALAVENGGPTSVSGRAQLPQIANGYNTPRQFMVEFIYPGNVPVSVGLSDEQNGILFVGDEGRIFVNRKRLSGKPVERLARDPLPEGAIRFDNNTHYWGTANFIHLREFLDCVRTGKPPISDAASQHRSATACHLANISMRLGRPLRWDAAQERFLNDPEADRMLSRPQRQGYEFG
ncbi:MAG TPA: Gfo/Idh/MocA family oxidoreductase [Pirellulales bacterium]|nr:Gfo/Idh/MocA family oxidoreductase [Pirellulales bacterium]